MWSKIKNQKSGLRAAVAVAGVGRASAAAGYAGSEPPGGSKPMPRDRTIRRPSVKMVKHYILVKALGDPA